MPHQDDLRAVDIGYREDASDRLREIVRFTADVSRAEITNERPYRYVGEVAFGSERLAHVPPAALRTRKGRRISDETVIPNHGSKRPGSCRPAHQGFRPIGISGLRKRQPDGHVKGNGERETPGRHSTALEVLTEGAHPWRCAFPPARSQTERTSGRRVWCPCSYRGIRSCRREVPTPRHQPARRCSACRGRGIQGTRATDATSRWRPLRPRTCRSREASTCNSACRRLQSVGCRRSNQSKTCRARNPSS